MTTLLYFSEPGRLTYDGRVTAKGVDAVGPWIATAATIFYPKGGGQPADNGSIGDINVIDVKQDRECGFVKHYLAHMLSIDIGDMVDMRVCATSRTLHSRWHSAGHLIAAIIEREYSDLKATGAHQYPGEGRVEFSTNADAAIAASSVVNASLEAAILASLAIRIHRHPDGSRYVQIDGHVPVGCGGTHVTNTSELTGLTVTKIGQKGSTLRVSYTMT
ncbi:alanyl-tRNA synthetase (plasmid) [Undibacterium sp. YM2]|uniref:hypothetical protein n=1 Tax=Undibacterium sp. YM2 TaxID=2058625 RepID=UPI001331F535|nr:hypothetical protein [Undibacterium sp. YM2]BBB70229.1 alanyl-tRNA synthetase [Undibacterium sp. YM2]